MMKHALPFLIGVVVGYLVVPWVLGMLGGGMSKMKTSG